MNPGNHNVEIIPVFSSGDESCSSVRLMSNVSMTITKPAVWHKIQMREGLELIVGWVLYVLWENCGRKGKMYENNLQDWEKWLDSDGRSGTPEVFGGDDPTEHCWVLTTRNREIGEPAENKNACPGKPMALRRDNPTEALQSGKQQMQVWTGGTRVRSTLLLMEISSSCRVAFFRHFLIWIFRLVARQVQLQKFNVQL